MHAACNDRRDFHKRPTDTLGKKRKKLITQTFLPLLPGYDDNTLIACLYIRT